MRERLWQDLDRDVAIQLCIVRTKHLAHPAVADRRGDVVDAEACAWGKCEVDVSIRAGAGSGRGQFRGNGNLFPHPHRPVRSPRWRHDQSETVPRSCSRMHVPFRELERITAILISRRGVISPSPWKCAGCYTMTQAAVEI